MKKNKKKFETLKFTCSKKRSKPNLKNIYLNFKTRIVLSLISVLLLLIIIILSSCKIYSLLSNYNKEEEYGFVNYEVCGYDDKCSTNININKINNINNILLNYNYSYNSTINRKYNISYWVESSVNIESLDEELYSMNDKISKTNKITYITNGFNIVENVSVKMNDYYKIYKKYLDLNMKYVPVMYVRYTLYMNNNGIISSVSSMNLQVEKDEVSISTSNLDNDILVNDLDIYNYVGILVVICFIAIGLCILFIIKTTNMIFKTIDNCNEYYKELHELLEVYKKDIVISKDNYNYDNKVKVKSFNDLLKLSKMKKKKIKFYNINDIKCIFVIEDNDKVYQYILKCLD